MEEGENCEAPNRHVIKCENPLKAENQTNFIEYQINMFIKMRTLN